MRHPTPLSHSSVGPPLSGGVLCPQRSSVSYIRFTFFSCLGMSWVCNLQHQGNEDARLVSIWSLGSNSELNTKSGSENVQQLDNQSSGALEKLIPVAKVNTCLKTMETERTGSRWTLAIGTWDRILSWPDGAASSSCFL